MSQFGSILAVLVLLSVAHFQLAVDSSTNPDLRIAAAEWLVSP